MYESCKHHERLHDLRIKNRFSRSFDFKPNVWFTLKHPHLFYAKLRVKMPGLENFWFQSCENQKIPPETAKTWLNNIKTKYNTESHRVYHNLDVLNKKCDFLISIESMVQFSDYLVFAIVFQYYNFDLKTDSNESNFTAFREFCDEAGVDNVSVAFKIDFQGINI